MFKVSILLHVHFTSSAVQSAKFYGPIPQTSHHSHRFLLPAGPPADDSVTDESILSLRPLRLPLLQMTLTFHYTAGSMPFLFLFLAKCFPLLCTWTQWRCHCSASAPISGQGARFYAARSGRRLIHCAASGCTWRDSYMMPLNNGEPK